MHFNRYSFFETFEEFLIPNSKIELRITLNSDADGIWQAADNCRVIVTKLRLWVPRIVLNGVGNTYYIETYLKPRKWFYLRESLLTSDSTSNKVGIFKITSAINRPRHVFVWITNDASLSKQTANKYLFNTFNVADDKKLVTAYLEVGNGIRYPDNQYQASAEESRVFRDVLKYEHSNNDYSGGTMLSRANFTTIFPFLYFDLTNQQDFAREGTTKLNFHYQLSGATNANYTIDALVLYEQDIELTQINGKLLVR